MRKTLIGAVLLAALLTLCASAQPAPAPLRVQATLQRADLVAVSWTWRADQHLACVIKQPNTLLDCVQGRGNYWQQGPSRDEFSRVAYGDVLEVRVYAVSGVQVAEGESSAAYRLWFPVVRE